MVAELLGKKTGYCRGYGGSMHIADMDTGNLGANGIVGGGMAIGVGAAFGAQIRGEDRVSVIFFSDGACNSGVFGESLNLAAIWNLPCAGDRKQPVRRHHPYRGFHRARPTCTSGPPHTASPPPGGRQRRAGRLRMTQEAVRKCRKGKGPMLIEAKTYRHMGHHVNDPGKYMPEDELAYYKAHDPVDRARTALIEMSGVEKSQIEAIEAEIRKEFEEAVEFAKDSREITWPNSQPSQPITERGTRESDDEPGKSCTAMR